MDHRVPNPNSSLFRQLSHRKRSLTSGNTRKRDRNDLICVVCHAPAMGKKIEQNMIFEKETRNSFQATISIKLLVRVAKLFSVETL